MQYDAVIMAGGESSSELKQVAPYSNEALIIIGSYPMIYYVYSALRATPSIKNIVVSGPVECLRSILPHDEKLFFVESGENAIETFSRGVNFLGGRITSKVLAVPTDIPFITSEAISDFLTNCESAEADIYYPITSKEVNELKYPGVIRTYVHLKDGIFTGGNLFLLRSAALPGCMEFGLKVISRRKNPLAIARLFGFGLVCKYLAGQLSIKAAEKRLYEVAGINGKGIISPYAEVGVDVDKPDDLLLAQRYLSGVSFER